ncbi:uncharacterized protein I303_107726 [Kwoniella dejecticola CBS 10117]|uniref:Uncharacterized protein n=1 Tax=Kwoniella dejecticola CBS 10117 TaxID=1296121 RepID=A0A1A5ZVI4_9TREE|nr:uncharacterized protein I303_07731 [Kwoniella dejecticola CBS 10117]OBR81821.1 hypothetical protein I303_07731 [Kwoniella dejecticola CBS 10117]
MSMLPPPVPSPRRQSSKSASASTPGSTSTSASPAGSSNSVKGEPTGEDRLNDIFKEFEDYKFTEDPAFNAGLPTVFSAIRGKKMSPSLIDKTIAEAQWFYFTTRIKKNPLPFSVYTQHIEKQTSPNLRSPMDIPSTPPPLQGETNPIPNANTSPEPSRASARMDHLTEAMRMMGNPGTEGQTSLTFDKLVQLIQEGRADELKGKEIPDELNTSPPSESSLNARPKPWQAFNQSTTSPPSVSTPSLDHLFSSPPQTSLAAMYSISPSQSASSRALDSQDGNPISPEQFDAVMRASMTRDHPPALSNDSASQAIQMENQTMTQQMQDQAWLDQHLPLPALQHSQIGTPGISVQSPTTPGFEYINWPGEESMIPHTSSISHAPSGSNADHTHTSMDVYEVKQEPRTTP